MKSYSLVGPYQSLRCRLFEPRFLQVRPLQTRISEFQESAGRHKRERVRRRCQGLPIHAPVARSGVTFPYSSNRERLRERHISVLEPFASGYRLVSTVEYTIRRIAGAFRETCV